MVYELDRKYIGAYGVPSRAAQLFFPLRAAPFAAVHRLSFRRCADGRGGRHSRISAGKGADQYLFLCPGHQRDLFSAGTRCHCYGRVFQRPPGGAHPAWRRYCLGVRAVPAGGIPLLHPEPGAEAALPVGSTGYESPHRPGHGVHFQLFLDTLCRAGIDKCFADGVFRCLPRGGNPSHRGVYPWFCPALFGCGVVYFCPPILF